MARVHLLDKAARHCDRSFDALQAVHLPAPARRSRVPGQYTAQNAFYAEGLKRSPRGSHGRGASLRSPRARPPMSPDRLLMATPEVATFPDRAP